MDQKLDRFAGIGWTYFLDRYMSYNKIFMTPKEQDKNTFTCLHGTFTFKRMPFGLCSIPTTLYHCMMAIYSNMVEYTIKVFMDYFSIFGDSFNVFWFISPMF